MTVAISVEDVSFCYGDHQALQQLTLSVHAAEVFGVLGPNGGGKTTLFRLLSTLLPLQRGQVSVLGYDLASHARDIRQRIGVTFQSPSVDTRLTVRENLAYQSRLYGLSRREARERVERVLERVGLRDRAEDRVESLSGGMRRRVEIGKGLLHDPQVLLLDEPSTGLDPGARIDLWRYLNELRSETGVTVLVTTHLMEEAERCDRLAILDRGRLVAQGTPDELRAGVGGDCITIRGRDIPAVQDAIAERYATTGQIVGGALRLEVPDGHELIAQLMEEKALDISSVTLGKPTLEDVFIHHTGHRFWDETS